MKSLMNILAMGVLSLLLFSSNTEACTYNPVAVIQLHGELVANGQSRVGYDGGTLYFDGRASYAVDPPYLSGYRWEYRAVGTSAWTYFGGGSTQTLTINLPGTSPKEYQVRLRVRDVAGKYGYSTITVTIKPYKDRYYYVKDHLGSIRTTVDMAGNVTDYDDYYPFGLSMPGRSSNSANPNDDYKFTGHERDDEAGLTLDYMMARNYDPIIGRFLQIDPASAQYPSWTPYHYVRNNPILRLDPTGKWDVTIHLLNNRATYGYGVAIVTDKQGKEIYRFQVRAEGTGGRDRMKNKADSPLGIYNIPKSAWMASSTIDKRKSFGPNARLVMIPESGEILSSGRKLIRIHGGRQEIYNEETDTWEAIDGATLEKTYGCFRAFDADMLAFKQIIDNLQAADREEIPGKVTVLDDLQQQTTPNVSYSVPEDELEYWTGIVNQILKGNS